MKLLQKIELSKAINAGRPQLIIVEGPQGVGKTTFTNTIREHLTQTNLLRLTGGKSDSLSMIRINYIALQNMLDTLADNDVDINYLFDRTFITEWCYRRLGYKGDKNSFEECGLELITKLAALSRKYDITFVLLTADGNALESRLGREKAQYNNVKFCKENSLNQLAEYKALFQHIMDICIKEYGESVQAPKFIVYDTSDDKPIDDKVNELLNLIYNVHNEGDITND